MSGEAFIRSYDKYVAEAFPAAELRPLPMKDGRCEGGEFVLVNITGVTLVDTLDTLALMGNASEFRRAVAMVSEGFSNSICHHSSLKSRRP